jgi:hypothetical protein
MVAGKELLESCKDSLALKQDLQNQIPRPLQPDESILVVEAIVLHDWQIEQNRPVV